MNLIQIFIILCSLNIVSCLSASNSTENDHEYLDPREKNLLKLELELTNDPQNCDLLFKYAQESHQEMKYSKFLEAHDRMIQNCPLSGQVLHRLDSLMYWYGVVTEDSSRLVNTNRYFDYIKETALYCAERNMPDTAIWVLQHISENHSRRCELNNIYLDIYSNSNQQDSVRKYKRLITEKCN